MGWTYLGLRSHLETFRGVALPTNFRIVLITAAVAPTADSTTFAAFTEIAAGNGYTAGGQTISLNATDFDVITTGSLPNNRSLIQIKDIVWTATGGQLPSNGVGARYALLLDDNPTPASREVWAWWDLEENRLVSTGQPFTLDNLELSHNIPAA